MENKCSYRTVLKSRLNSVSTVNQFSVTDLKLETTSYKPVCAWTQTLMNPSFPNAGKSVQISVKKLYWLFRYQSLRDLTHYWNIIIISLASCSFLSWWELVGSLSALLGINGKRSLSTFIQHSTCQNQGSWFVLSFLSLPVRISPFKLVPDRDGKCSPGLIRVEGDILPFFFKNIWHIVLRPKWNSCIVLYEVIKQHQCASVRRRMHSQSVFDLLLKL